MTLNPTNSLKVSEFFYSLQGEGPTAGVPAYFIRLTACNLLCKGSWVCDTIDVWRRGHRIAFSDLVKQIGEHEFSEKLMRGAHLVWTGGEPLLQQHSIEAFWISEFWKKDMPHPYMEIETNGTREPDSGLLNIINQWNVSPKLANSGVLREERYKPNVIHKLILNIDPRQLVFKFVVTTLSDIDEIEKDFIEPFGIKPWQVYLMPGADTADLLQQRISWIADVAKIKCFRLSNRMQIQLWNQTTGV